VKLTAKLTAELTARKKQYNYYRDELLTFGDDVPMVPLEEIVTMKRGVRVIKRQLSENGYFPVYQNSMTPLGYYTESNCSANTAFIISAGAAGEVGYSTVDFWAADDCFFFTCSENLQSRFFYYTLLYQQDYLFSKVRRASVPRLSRTVVEQLKIPIPPLSQQERIISILDRFDVLTTDLSNGLPAEITARQRHYEYYRDKLLQFRDIA